MTEAGSGTSIGSAVRRRALSELLPRLLRAHAPPLLDRSTLAALADLAGGDGAGTTALLDAVLGALPNGSKRFRDRSVPLPLVCREILAPVARELGERWVRDDACFTAVTIGAGRLHAVLRALSAATGSGSAGAAAWRILLLPTPGEHHRLGVSMVSALFRNAGWIVQTGEPDDENALDVLLDRLPPDLVGFSCSCDRHLPALTDAVRAVRRLRPELPVVAGGPLFERRPDLERRLRLDAVFTDGTTAPERAAILLRGRRPPGAARTSSIALGRVQHRDTKIVPAGSGGETNGGGIRVARQAALPDAGLPDLGPQVVGAWGAGRGCDPQDRAGGG